VSDPDRHPIHPIRLSQLFLACAKSDKDNLVRFRAQCGLSETVQLTALAVVNPNISIREINRIHDFLHSIASWSSRFYPYRISLIYTDCE